MTQTIPEQRSYERMSHTPGPWDFYYREGQGYLVCQKTSREFVADCAGLHSDDGLDEANARLIAAAPELLEALREAEDALNRSYDVQDYPGDGTSVQDAALRTVRAAIAKAEGKQ